MFCPEPKTTLRDGENLTGIPVFEKNIRITRGLDDVKCRKRAREKKITKRC
jgi:hypothetical protein